MGAALQTNGETKSVVTASSIRKKKRSMDHFAGLDRLVKNTSVRLVDDTDRIVHEVKVASEPKALLDAPIIGNGVGPKPQRKV
jgi:hypothetical protein